MATIADRLRAARKEQFVGRTDELDFFDKTLSGENSEVCLIHVCAPAGVGKTSLLREFQSRCKVSEPVWVDGSSVAPTTEGFVQALGPIEPVEGKRLVLFIDEYDSLLPLDGWIRDTFLASLPADSLVVLAGRFPLGNRWTADPAWQSLSASVWLRNLTESEQREFLELREIPEEHRQPVIEFTRGHPLAMSLVVANLDQAKDLPFSPEAFPDVIRSLLERFADNVPSDLHRRALETSALLRVTTEGVISSIVDESTSFNLFEWLRNLSFVDSGSEGVRPNELTREAIALDLRWRNPDLHAQLHDRARAYYSERLARTRGDAHQAVVSDYIYLHRDNPNVQPFFDWNFEALAYLDRYDPKDRETLVEMTRRHEGDESAAILEHWLDIQPESAVILRSAADTSVVEGFFFRLELQSLTPAQIQRDPAAIAATQYLAAKAPLRKGEVAILFRFWMDSRSHQAVSPVQSLIFVAFVQISLSVTNLAHTFIPCCDPDFWMPMFTYGALVRLVDSGFEIGDRRQGLYGHDWRLLTPKMWLDLLSQRELSVSSAAPENPRLPDVVLLSREAFSQAVQDALKNLNNPGRLVDNPLLRSRVVTGSLSGSATPQQRMDSLRKAIKTIADGWKVSGRDAKLYDALEQGYVQPAPNQDKAAERLDVSVATFRRHLQAAVERLTEGLWNREIGI